MNKKTSSKKMASSASKVLRNKHTSKTQKKLAASVLSQAAQGKETGVQMESIASKVLQSDKYAELTQSFAGSVLSQSDKNR